LAKKTFIEITPPRGICQRCDDHPTTTQTLDWFDRSVHHTKAYEQHVLLSLVHSTITDVSIKENLGEGVIQHIIDTRISENINWKSIKKIGLLGIDEISLKKGYQDFVTIITSRYHDEIKILAVIKGKDKPAIKAFLSSIPKKKRKSILAVCCDMCDGFISAVKDVFGNDKPIIVDRFHVAKLYRRCLVKLRQKELKRLRKELSTEAYHELKPAIAILVKQQECYSKEEKKKLEILFKYSPAIKAAYRLARQLTTIFNTHHRKKTAITKFNEWINKVEASELNCFDGFIKSLNKYKKEIANYFIGRHSSGFVEGFNNKIKVMKRRCYGIYNIKHFFQRLFLDSEGYKHFNNNQAVTASL